MIYVLRSRHWFGVGVSTTGKMIMPRFRSACPARFSVTTLALVACLGLGVQRCHGQDAARAGREGAITVPTPHDVVAKMLQLAKLTPDDTLYDLGCGDGRIVVAAAKNYGCHAVGFEINPLKIRQSRRAVKRAGVESRVRIENEDIFKLDLTPASVVTLYLLPSMNDRLVTQLTKLKSGSRIVCHDFAIDAFKPERTITMESKETGAPHSIYLYRVPLNKQEREAD